MKTLFYLPSLLLAFVSPFCAAEPFPANRSEFNGCALVSVQIGNEKVQVLIPEKPAAGKALGFGVVAL